MAELTIAVIDDATMIRDLIKKYVRQNFPSAQILDAADGLQGKQLLTTQKVDLVLCDWEMPEMSGEELLNWVRNDSHIKDIPFIMVTSRGDKAFVVKAIESKVSDYLVKPFNNQQFIEKISRACKRHGLEIGGAIKPHAAISTSSSVSVLTGSSSTSAVKPTTSKLTAKPSATTKEPPPKGIAIIRTASAQIRCAIKKLDLKGVLAVFKPQETMPHLLEQVSLDLEFASQESPKVIRINGFVQMLKSNDPRPDSELVSVLVQFLDEDPQKRLLISEYVGQFR